MGSAKPQLSMVVDDPARAAAEEEHDIESELLLRERLFSAMRTFAANHIILRPDGTSVKGFDACASELDKRWSRKGRPVSASALRSALFDVERNNFRAEWLLWFAKQSDEVNDVLLEMAGVGRAEKKPEDELRDLKDEIRREFPRQAESLIRKGKAPRR